MIKRRIKAIIFDLDNVLYDERDYILPAYRDIAIFLSKQCTVSEKQIFDKIVLDLQEKGTMYPRLFNDLVGNLGLDEAVVPEILHIYSSIPAKLSLYPEVESLLANLKQDGMKLGLVTNGSVSTQRNKVRLLGLEKYFDEIIYAREAGNGKEKPDPKIYEVALERLHAVPEESVCIGDNPHTDFWGAKQLGMPTIRLLAGEFKDTKLSKEYEADIIINSLSEIRTLLEGSSMMQQLILKGQKCQV